jgi:hypothetical protein
MTDRKSKIREWLFEVIVDSSWRKYNDLHLDKIDDVFKNKRKWVEGGIQSFLLVTDIIKENNLPYSVEIAFFLKSRKRETESPLDFDKLTKELDYTPPSLYAFHNDSDEMIRLKQNGIKIKGFVYQNVPLKNLFYFQKYHEGDGEYRRVLYLIAGL